MDQKVDIKAWCAALGFSVLVGFSFMGIKSAIPYADSLQILVHRYNFAFLGLAVLLLFRVAKVNLRGKPKRDLALTAGFYIGFMALQVVGLEFATSIEGSIIFAIVPIIAKIIASVFLGEKSTMLQNGFVGMTVAALIAMIVLGSGQVTFHWGAMMILLLSSIAMAISNVFMRYVREQYKPVEISAAIISSGMILFNLVFIVYSAFRGTLHTYFEPLKHVEFVIATAYLGIGCILISAQAISYLLSRMEAVKATIFGNVSTAISIIAGVVILGEPLQYYHIICATLIVVGVIGLSMAPGKPEEMERPEPLKEEEKIEDSISD